jgi:hypothetical protein
MAPNQPDWNSKGSSRARHTAIQGINRRPVCRSDREMQSIGGPQRRTPTVQQDHRLAMIGILHRNAMQLRCN